MLNASKSADIIAHVGNHHYALRAFPGVAVVPKQKTDSGKPKTGSTLEKGGGLGGSAAPLQVVGPSMAAATALTPAAAIVSDLAATAPLAAAPPVSAAPSQHLPLVLQLMGQKPPAAL